MNDSLIRYLEANRDRYLEELRALVGQDSGSFDKAGVDAVQSWLQARLAGLGFAVERVPNQPHGDDLVARLPGTGRERVRGRVRGRVLLLGHADTVFPAGTAAARPLTIAGDVIHGPGACDMKGGLLCGIYAVEALLASGWPGLELLSFVVVSDEEIGARHSIPLLEREGRAHDAVLTLEAARENGDIVTARKAVRWYTVEAAGRAAHAGVEPEKGASATLAIARLVVAAAVLNDLRPGVTLNTGELRGGSAPNVVADHALARFELRAWTAADLDAAEAALRALTERDWVPGVTMTMSFEPGSGMPAMERTPGVVALEELARASAASLGFALQGAATGGASDVAYAMRGGTPGLDGLGPIGGLDHGPDEYILLSSIVSRTALLARLLAALGERELP
ncbi:MAG TPA: M20/M25/M40 family metallo-hydrolase [Thermomicrobiaceae bacterium]|nr:M20/M25/M40 family metallo-hydrolase [Thermomicrobiaceae bacterium]